ncbi:unnamed protein product [Sphenostylis stenocarpa]|uniref:Uncharacterized protein n=1 Tax=Sphenostylis stenocarpa TaxID=92480 RepID=A0AA86RZM9_9FABA|nr:unnamed protein product [Sphenostylis stenocarpa]
MANMHVSYLKDGEQMVEVMKRKMKIVRLSFLLFLLLQAISSQSCSKQDRLGLSALSSRFQIPFTSDIEYCCEREAVKCNSSTGRVAELMLRESREQYINYSDLSVFKDLKKLYLSFNNIFGCVREEELTNLEVLHISYNKLDNAASILSCLDGLSSLNGNYLTNDILPSLEGFTSLKELHLSDNELDSDLHIEGLCSKLRNLKVLDLSGNNFKDSDIGSALRLSTLTNLTNLDLGYNNIHYFVVRQGSKSLSRLDVLALDGNMIDGNKLRDSLRALSSSIRVLSMSRNTFNGTIVAGDFKDLSNLKYLELDGSSNMENKFFMSIGELTSLKFLSLLSCQINGNLPHADWSKLKKLEELDLSSNEFNGPLPSSFVNMTSLRILELSQNHFIGQFDSKIASLTSLEHFGFIGNQFEVPLSFAPFANHSNLKSIDGEGNKVILDLQPSLQTWIPKFQLQVLCLPSMTENNSLPLPRFLLHQNNLTSLDLSSCRLEGEFPHWLFQNNTKLTEVLLRNCSFTGTMQLPSHSLPKIEKIDVSDNIIIGQIPSKNISSIYPNLQYLYLSSNHIQGSIPRELGQMKLLEELDLSNNQLSGEISEDIFGAGHRLHLLKLSNNNLEGSIFTIPTDLEYLLLNDNKFNGRVPSHIFNTSIISLDVSNNHLVGKIPNLIKNLSELLELHMSNNHFEGFIPLELAQLEDLLLLDLAQNNLTGVLPSFLNSSVRFIHLNNNQLTGLPQKLFNGDSPLVMLDLSYNEISSNIQDLIHDLSYTNVHFLLLRDNHFTGDIPKQLCRLIDLTMLDLSHNNFSNTIPHCLGKMPFNNKNLDPLLKENRGTFSVGDYIAEVLTLRTEQKKEKASFTSKKRVDTYAGSILAYMSGIDLSQNKLKGNIPYELGNLTSIHVLNLSHNELIGQIPDSFSKLVQTESLDLSFNMLSGQIPAQLNILTSLAVFSVAHNNLSGPTPERTRQFSTFDESSYEGNPFLCGPPLPKSCNPASTVIPKDSDTDKDDGSLVDMYAFCVSFVVAYTLALLATAAALYINPYWRQAWLYYMELITLNCYYFIVDNLCRFSNSRNM